MLKNFLSWFSPFMYCPAAVSHFSTPKATVSFMNSLFETVVVINLHRSIYICHFVSRWLSSLQYYFFNFLEQSFLSRVTQAH